MVYVEDTNKVVFQGLDGYIVSEKMVIFLFVREVRNRELKSGQQEYKGCDR